MVTIAFLGPTDLMQYVVNDVDFVEANVQKNNTGDRVVRVNVVLGRKILNEVLLTYLPTMLIMVIIYITSFFKPFYFEATVTVNLTAMLVLTTMFISTSNGLPKTSYVKMIDIWFIFALSLTLLEVIITAVLEYLMDDHSSETR